MKLLLAATRNYCVSLICVFSLSFSFQSSDAQSLDRYGGYVDIPVKGGATGSFRVGQLGADRWVLVTPDGNAFWMRGVADITGNVSAAQENALKSKYGEAWWTNGGKFFQQANRRLRKWGFNTLGEYAALIAWPGVNPDSMPYIQMLNTSHTGMDSNAVTQSTGAIKDIIDGTDTKIYTGYRGDFPDVFDPKFSQIVTACITQNGVAGNAALSRWLLGTVPDDRDYLFGFGSPSAHPHLGWIAAVTAPFRANSVKHAVHFTDTTVFVKLALANYLQTKYGSVDALNTAWGADYTTFASDGGWPNGHGLLDESGRNAWIGKDGYTLKNTPAAVRVDLDSFLVLLVDKYFEVTSNATRAALPGKLIIGPEDVSVETRPAILEEEGKYVDVIAMSAGPDSMATHPDIAGMYRLTGKPMFCETYLTANGDSPLAGHAGNRLTDTTTQEKRGATYATCISEDLGSRGGDGMCPMIGAEWWAWTDSPGEEMNFGLVTNLDNAYDGIEDRTAAGTDQWGYPTGGEANNYSDLLAAVTETHASVYDSLRLSASAIVQHSSVISAPLLSCNPNPFSQSITIHFTTPETGAAQVAIVDVLGVEVRRLFSGELEAGEHSYTWDARGTSPGMYWCEVRMNGHVERVGMVEER